MKNALKNILVLLFASTFLFLSYRIISRINYIEEVQKNIETIPKFNYQNIKGGVFTNQNLERESSTIFIYFNTECEFCNEEAKLIQDNINRFNKSQLVFVSFEEPELIKKFAQKHQLTTYDNVYFLCDNKVTFATTFDVNSMPCLVLYDKNQNLIEKVKGQIKVESLIKKMNAK
ncbi:redoxin domain-containing protein [Flavobacterium sp. CFBP9031]|uniref:peroxiredoxin family protein n=1 Tax=Flavobacterium sp. CFBP9031 TaxID=3096538 RepID=UPI002A69D837|nr:redoxin domain-containing protein [Flavobacterium sp. CFBP9031]MDY0988870.1 redoxin domain-containing protein [Flavobacterium sp. CFBP9031]